MKGFNSFIETGLSIKFDSKATGIQFTWNQKHLKTDWDYDPVPKNQLILAITQFLGAYTSQGIQLKFSVLYVYKKESTQIS